MLVLGSFHADIGVLHLSCFELCLSLCHIGFRRRASLVPVLGEPERRRVTFHGIVQDLLLDVGASELEVVERQFSLQTELCRLEIGGARLCEFTGGGDRSPYTSPEIQFVGKVEWQDEIARRAGSPRWKIRSVGRIANRSN